METILIVLLVLFLIGGIGAGPWWPYSRGYGYWPSGILGILFIIVLIFLLTGHRF